MFSRRSPWLIAAVQGCSQPQTVVEATEASRISERTLYEWLERFADKGISGMKGQNSRPLKQTNQLPLGREALVLHLRELPFTT